MSTVFHSLVVIDDSKIWENAFAELESVAQQMDYLEERVLLFSNEQLQFARWMETTFRSEKSEISTLNSKLFKLRQFHNWAIAISEIDKISFIDAYSEVLREDFRYTNGSQREREEIDRKRLQRDAFMQGRVKRQQMGEEEENNDFDDLFSEPRDCGRNASESPDDVGESRPRPSGEKAEALRRIYLRLVRALHPDLHASKVETVSWRSRMWLRGQEAFRRRDLAELENLFLLCQLRDRNFRALTLSDIRNSRSWLMKELKRLQQQAKHFKKSPAWGFSHRQKHVAIQRQMKRQMEREREGVLREISQLEEKRSLMEYLSKDKSQSPKPRRAKRPQKMGR
jgi:hypothetical protein